MKNSVAYKKKKKKKKKKKRSIPIITLQTNRKKKKTPDGTSDVYKKIMLLKTQTCARHTINNKY